MGLRGPAPEPLALKVLKGTARRPDRVPQPSVGGGLPACPAWLEPEAKREWRRVAPELRRLGLLTVVDRAALAGYCQAYSRWRAAEERVRDGELTFTTQTGFVGVRPEVAIAQKSLALVRAFCHEFGLTPSARARMTVPERPADGGLDALLG